MRWHARNRRDRLSSVASAFSTTLVSLAVPASRLRARLSSSNPSARSEITPVQSYPSEKAEGIYFAPRVFGFPIQRQARLEVFRRT